MIGKYYLCPRNQAINYFRHFLTIKYFDMITLTSNERFIVLSALLTRIDFVNKMLDSIHEECNLRKLYLSELDSLNSLYDKLSNPK